jgi:hypothetical protein
MRKKQGVVGRKYAQPQYFKAKGRGEKGRKTYKTHLEGGNLR